MQQPASAEADSPERAQDGVGAVEHLEGQPGERQTSPGEVLCQITQQRPEVLSIGHISGGLHQIGHRSQQRLNHHQPDDSQGPVHWLTAGKPAPCEHQQQRQRFQAASQIVQNLPACHDAQPVAHPLAVGVARPGQCPRQQLPVAANPAMPSFDIGTVARRVLLVDLHVAEQAGSCITPFDQVVAENLVIRQATFQGAGERVHVVDALADEGTLLEQVLVNVRYRASVGIDAGITAKQPGVDRARGAGQADAHSRLQHRVAGNDLLAVTVEQRTIQRVHHGRHALASDIARQQGVGVQRDHVTHPAQWRDVADDGVEAFLSMATQQGVEFNQLAAFALVAHPHAFARVPATRPMQQKESVAESVRVFSVEQGDCMGGLREQLGVLRLSLFRRIQKIAEQREIQVAVAVGEKPHFKTFHQFVHICRAGDQRRDHHQASRAIGNTAGKIHFRQRRRQQTERHQPVDQADCQSAGHDQAGNRHHQKRCIGHPVALRGGQ